MNLKSFCMSWKTTSRYSGWMPALILCLYLVSLLGRPDRGEPAATGLPRPRSRFLGIADYPGIDLTGQTWGRGRPFCALAAPPHHVEELGIALGCLHLVEQELHRLDLIHPVEQLPQDPD